MELILIGFICNLSTNTLSVLLLSVERKATREERRVDPATKPLTNWHRRQDERTHDGAPASPGSLRYDGGTPRRCKTGRPLPIGLSTPRLPVRAHGAATCHRLQDAAADAQSTSPSDKKKGIKPNDLLMLSSRNQPIDYFVCTSMHSREVICTRRRNHHMPAVLGIVERWAVSFGVWRRRPPVLH